MDFETCAGPIGAEEGAEILSAVCVERSTAWPEGRHGLLAYGGKLVFVRAVERITRERFPLHFPVGDLPRAFTTYGDLRFVGGIAFERLGGALFQRALLDTVRACNPGSLRWVVAEASGFGGPSLAFGCVRNSLDGVHVVGIVCPVAS